MTSGLNKENASMNTVVDNVHAVDLVLSIEVCIISTLDIVNDWTPRLIIVDKVTKPRCIDHSQTETDTSLLDVGADGLNLDGFGDDIVARALALSRGVQRGVEKSVD